MDTYSILDKKLSQAAPGTVPSSASLSSSPTTAGAAAAPAMAREPLRFPGEDGGKSLSEMAQRDLDATLQLLAERAQYITGASGAAIALRKGEDMICCASAGPSAPELGAELQIDSGLSAESVRTRQILHCDDAENDPRVNRESCRVLGIVSVVVMPLVRGEEVYGLFELLAGRPHAFEERDFLALQRLAEMIQTALEHAEAARRAEKELGTSPERGTAAGAKAETAVANQPHHPEAGSLRTPPEKQTPAPERKAATETAANPDSVTVATPNPVTSIAFGKVRNCESCGFPISEGRRLCLDCEAASPNVDSVRETPEPFGRLLESEASWMRSHVYLIATVLLVVATIAVVIWRF